MPTTPAKCPRKRRRPRGAEPARGVRSLSGRDGEGGISALRNQEGCGVPGRRLPLCRRCPWPLESLLCPGAAPAASSLMFCPGERSAGSGRRRSGKGLPSGKGLGCLRLVSGSSPAPLPRILGPGGRSQEQEAGCCGRGCSRAGSGSPLCPRPAEDPAGLCRSRPCLRAPFPLSRAAATGCLGPGGES